MNKRFNIKNSYQIEEVFTVNNFISTDENQVESTFILFIEVDTTNPEIYNYRITNKGNDVTDLVHLFDPYDDYEFIKKIKELCKLNVDQAA